MRKRTKSFSALCNLTDDSNMAGAPRRAQRQAGIRRPKALGRIDGNRDGLAIEGAPRVSGIGGVEQKQRGVSVAQAGAITAEARHLLLTSQIEHDIAVAARVIRVGVRHSLQVAHAGVVKNAHRARKRRQTGSPRGIGRARALLDSALPASAFKILQSRVVGNICPRDLPALRTHDRRKLRIGREVDGRGKRLGKLVTVERDTHNRTRARSRRKRGI